MFRKRVYLHRCTRDVGAGMTKWQADWSHRGGGQAYAITTDDTSAATRTMLLNSLGAVLAEQGIKRYKIIERDCCDDCCRHL